jgi:hypothetical protein
MKIIFAILGGLLTLTTIRACELCAVYRAGDAQGQTSAGVIVSVASQYIPYHTTQFQGEEVNPALQERLDSVVTHLVAGYNFSPRFGISVNVPITYLDYKRDDRLFGLVGGIPVELPSPPEKGTESGLGDVSLIGRATVYQKKTREASLFVNALLGVKFPTGDDDRLEHEIDQTVIYDQFPGAHDDPLSHSTTSIHEHMLSLGSGSFDGIFGLTMNANWQRWFFNAQFQYYLRTEGQSEFTYGDEVIVSGGPGFMLLRNDKRTLGLQANAVYDWMGNDELLGRVSRRTGWTAWYLGPQLNLTVGRQFSANIGVDVPLQIKNNWYQTVPDYRLHGGVSWTF